MKAALPQWLSTYAARIPASIQTKLLVGFLAIAALLVAVGAASVIALSRVNERAVDLVKLQRKIAAYRQIQHNTTLQLYSVSTAMVVRDFGAFARKNPRGDVDHLYLTSLIDRSGAMRVQYMGYRFDPDEMLRDLRALIRE